MLGLCTIHECYVMMQIAVLNCADEISDLLHISLLISVL